MYLREYRERLPSPDLEGILEQALNDPNL